MNVTGEGEEAGAGAGKELIMCQKVTYASKSEAQQDVKRIKANKQRFSRKNTTRKGGQKLLPYCCPYCEGWHLTTQKQKKYKRAA